MEAWIKLKTPCREIDINALVASKQEILETALTACTDAFHACPVPVPHDELFDRVRDEYERCMRQPDADKFRVSVSCPRYRSGDRVKCFEYALQRELLKAMKTLLPILPMDLLLNEIYTKLDVMTQRAWRIADRRIWLATRARVPAYSFPWASGAFRGYPWMTRFFQQCQRAFDDELIGFTRRRDPTGKDDREYAQAAAIGGAVHVFRFLYEENKGAIAPIESDIFDCAWAMQRETFIATVFRDKDLLAEHSHRVQNQLSRCARSWLQDHPNLYLVRSGRFDLVDQFVTNCLQSPDYIGPIRNTETPLALVYRECCRCGYLPVVVQLHEYYGVTRETLEDVLLHGTSQNFLVWVRTHHRAVYEEFREQSRWIWRSSKLRKHVNILSWLADEGLMDFDEGLRSLASQFNEMS